LADLLSSEIPSGSASSPSSSLCSVSASSTVAPVTQRVLVMPEAFSNGDNEDWASWLCYFKKCAKLNKWDDEQQRDFLSVRLRASALEIFLGLSEDTQNGVFRELVDALTEKFVPAERLELYKSEFNARRRGQDEKLIDLSAAIGKLARKAFPGAPAEIVDQLAKDRFIEALRSRDLRIKIREGSPKTLDNAVSRAIQLESIYEAEGGKTIATKPVHVVQQHDNHHRTDDAMTALLERNTAALETVVNLVKSFAGRQPLPERTDERDVIGTPRRPRKPTCWACGGTGHSRRDCLNRQSNQAGVGKPLMAGDTGQAPVTPNSRP
ncbi:hypothetical protein QZH41_015524, partial [Actinostola sp. cb2023]